MHIKIFFKYIFVFNFYFISIFCLSFYSWIKSYYGTITFNQLYYHIAMGFNTDAIMGTDKYYLVSFKFDCIYLPFLLSLSIVFLKYLSSKKNIFIFNKFLSKIFSLLINKNYINFFFIFFILNLGYSLSFHKFIINQYKSDYIKKAYVDESYNNIQALEKKNLIVIYVESLEQNYKSLSKNEIISFDNQIYSNSVDNFYMEKGTEWTVAAIVASQCGIPILPIGLLKENDHLKLGKFLHKKKCLSDFLYKNNYENHFLLGHESKFGGLDIFLKSHKYKIHDKSNMFNDLKKLSTSWENGYHDNEVLEYSKRIILELINDNKKFNMSILTVETHYPGYTNAKCKKRSSNNYQNAMNCTLDSLNSFLIFIEKFKILETTNIVIMGDHLISAPDKFIRKNFGNKRSIFNKFYSKNEFIINRDVMNHFDLYPSLIEFAGFEIKNSKMALGYSILNNDIDLNTYKVNINQLNKNINNFSKKYLSFWGL